MSIPVGEHYGLTKKQQDILGLLYRFRFTTSEQLSQALGISKSVMNKRLQLMVEMGYLGRRFSAEDKLAGKHARYFLGSKGLKVLKKLDTKFNSATLRNMRKENTVSEQFAEYSLGIFDFYNSLRSLHRERLHFFTRSQLANKYDYFADFMPGAYGRLETDKGDKDYFLEYLQNSKPFFTHVRRIKQYSDYFDSGEWEAGTDSSFPKVLLVCDDPVLQKRLLKKSSAILAEADDDLRFYVTTKHSDIWFDLSEPDEVLTRSPI